MLTLLAVVDTQDNGCGLVHKSCKTVEEKDEPFKVSYQLELVKIKANDRRRRGSKFVVKTRKSARIAGKDVDSEEREKAEQKREEHEKQRRLITSSISELMDSMKTTPVQPLPTVSLFLSTYSFLSLVLVGPTNCYNTVHLILFG